MTREEAKKELDQLEPQADEAWDRVVKETQAWDAHYNELLRQMSDLVANKPSSVGACHKRWLPLHTRKQQLKSFLELTN
jgi:phytoene dehydrogenase-like protein